MEENQEALKFEALLERFKHKCALVPKECHEALMYWFLQRETQRARIAAENRLRQVIAAGKKVFYANEEVPETVKAVLAKDGQNRFFEALRAQEDEYERLCEQAFKRTRWYHEVARPAAENVGIGPLLAGDFLWTIGGVSRFPTFGRLVRYAGLDVRDGRSPKREKGKKITWNPSLRTALFKITEVWNKMPDSPWRARWDLWKSWYEQNRPQVLEEKGGKGHIHNMARRKIQREFLRNLWTLWVEYEGGEVAKVG